MTLRTVRNGKEILRFDAQVVASSTSQRPGAERWSELVVYQLPSGAYVISKIGRSILAHRPDCPLVSPHMVTWLEAGEEGRVHRVPCLTCQPLVGDDMDPQTILETTRYTVLRAQNREELRSVLSEGRIHPPQVIQKLLNEI